MVSLVGYLCYTIDLPESDEWLDTSEQVSCGFIDSNESTIVELSESEESEDSDNTRVHFVDTSDSDNESNFGGCRNMNLAIEFGCSSCSDFVLSFCLVCCFILADSLEQFFSLSFVSSSTFLTLLF